ncbi:hypothetical protein ACIRG5_42260 [Lentzea sp. NPDC102401]|uniref:hypothetical protein n=1 Tax=Lentzea sp. NPDC102401 TaxID=3364128 RepID=UPI0037F901C6
MTTVERVRGRHVEGRPVADLLDQAAAQDWDTSLLSVHARRHRPYAPIPSPAPVNRWEPPALPIRWTWKGALDEDVVTADLARAYVPAVEPATLTELWFGSSQTAC